MYSSKWGNTSVVNWILFKLIFNMHSQIKEADLKILFWIELTIWYFIMIEFEVLCSTFETILY